MTKPRDIALYLLHKGEDALLMLPHVFKRYGNAFLVKVHREYKALSKNYHEETLFVASELEREKSIKHAAMHGLSSKKISIDPELLSGWKYRKHFTEVDASGKSALINIYRSFISK